MEAIKVSGLEKSFKKAKGKKRETVRVLGGVSFNVRQGEIFALLGANGAGKTTVINILATLGRADAGTAQVNGSDVASQAGEVRKSISLTGQFAAVDDVLSARENLMLIAQLRHVSDPANVAEKLLAQFNLSDAADRQAGTFSGGMRRRLDIAMGLIGSPAVIFLDEPTTGLDPESRGEMWKVIKKLAAGGTTVFLTTQYLDEADQLADRIAILHGGKIVAEGTARELKKLVPSGRLELRFQSGDELEAAAKLFANCTQDKETFTLTIQADGSAAEIMRVLETLRKAGIEPAEFAQKMPTLDDVFLKIVSKKEKK